ncbi:N-acetyltransferase [Luteipulveratus sp. YIM 133132]|uniref:N-acetyltransferase n=1 Tax=Luteipulveratus flavus TaxID=3031728 RepID=UPI0023B0F51F|nr:N-acetyltransferase [Luteipulveratus sp. YIM 133132]MDE9367378.1 N-acetyltransferase [Luteipulveratus sp. YIM 133132]
MSLDLQQALLATLDGTYPQVDGGWDLVRPWHPQVEAVVALTGHAYVAVRDDLVDRLPRERLDGYGGAHDPRVLAGLVGDGWVDCLDALLLHPGGATTEIELVARSDRAQHPRAALAQRVRHDVRVLGQARGDGLVTVGRGIAGLPEIGVETADGDGRALITAAVASIGGPVAAAVAPGNARALRTFLAAGFVPVGSVQLFVRSPAQS